MTVVKPLKHAALIKQWADGATIEYFDTHSKQWETTMGYPTWNPSTEYRIKPEPKPDFVFTRPYTRRTSPTSFKYDGLDNVKFTWDGETGVLKSVEIVK